MGYEKIIKTAFVATISVFSIDKRTKNDSMVFQQYIFTLDESTTTRDDRVAYTK